MKKLLSLLVALVFIAGMTGLAAAQGAATTPEKKMDKPAEKKMDKPADKMSGEKMEKGDKKMAAKHAKGTVKSAAADSIVVAGKEKGKDAEWTFAVDPKTKIKKGGKDIMAADVKAGDSVQLKYMEMGGKATAESVTVTGGGMAKKAEKSDAKNPCAAKK